MLPYALDRHERHNLPGLCLPFAVLRKRNPCKEGAYSRPEKNANLQGH